MIQNFTQGTTQN